MAERPDARAARHRSAPWFGIVAVVVASVAFRVPALLNASQTNSDAAVVGLQAMHVLRGEWSPFLWGSGYQTSVDSTWAAIVFALTGPTPAALMGSALALHIALTCLVFDTLRRRTSTPLALLLVGPLVLTGGPSSTYILYPPRQAALTLAVASLWATDRAGDAGMPPTRLRLALAGALVSLACFADPYALVLVPVAAVLAVLVAWPEGARRSPDAWRTMGSRLASVVAGGAAGLVPALLLWTRPGASHGQVGLTAGVVARNASLLWDPCLPWALGAKVYFARNAMDYAPWDAPPLVRALSAVGAASLVLGMVAGGALVFARRVPWAVRRLGLAGSVALPVTLLGFLTSVMVMDHFSARYLAAIVLACPFALGPVAVLMGPRRFAWAFAPFLLTSAIAGWVAYGPFVRGAWPVVVSDARPDVTRGDDELEAALTSRGVRYAMADYWVAYRLTFLFRERVVVVPTHAAEDRHPPYRAAFAASPRVAYVYDPLRSREAPGELEAEVRAGATAFERDAERIDVGRFSVLLLRARP